MKRKIDLVEEEHESEHEESESSGDESEDEEPRVTEEPRKKDVLSHLSRPVPEKRASDLLHNGLAELGIDTDLIKNKKLLSDLKEKEKGYRNVENTSDNESNNEESSSDIENQEEEEEVASENGVE
ncbi:unnamed protein product, partial [Porites lobata]